MTPSAGPDWTTLTAGLAGSMVAVFGAAMLTIVIAIDGGRNELNKRRQINMTSRRKVAAATRARTEWAAAIGQLSARLTEWADAQQVDDDWSEERART